MKPIQLLLLAFILFALVKVILKYRHGEMRRFQLLFWIVVWAGAAFIVNLPDTTTFLASLLGIGRGADLIIYVSFLIVFYLIFRIHLTLNRFEHEITQLVSKLALDQLGEPIDPASSEQMPRRRVSP
jgi:hypothetical protein